MAELAVYPLSVGCIDTPPPNSLVFFMRMEVGIFKNDNFQILWDI